MNKLQILLLSIIGLGLTTACTNDMEDTSSCSTRKAVEVKATIGQAKEQRAALGNDDNISYSTFEKNDEIGLFATGGLVAENKKLIHDDHTSFKNEELNWLGGNAKDVYAYFPYGIDKEEINIWRDASGSAYKAGFNDMLMATNGSVPEGTIINLGFTHQFAMLVIKRGIGFESAGDKKITITLNQSVAHTVGITKSGFNLKADGTNTATTLETNLGKYKENDVDYVIIPVGKINGIDVNVASITLKNNAGVSMTVAHTVKGNPQKNNKYIITVEMRKNQIITSPIEIVRWDDESIHIDEPAGISDAEELRNWAAAYNANETKDLGKYGSHDETSGKWTFRLLNDITIDGDFHGITEFKDIFDGQGHTITGLSIIEKTGESNMPTGFTRTLQGTIKNLVLKDAVIYAQTEVGAFAGKAESGAIVEKCQLIGASIIYGTDKVGAFIGNNEGSVGTNTCSQAPTVIVKQGTK